MVPSPTPSLQSPHPQDWGSQPPPKTSMAIISGTGKATDFKFGTYIHRVHPNKSPLKIFEKRECGRIQGLTILRYLYYLRNGESYELHIFTHILRIDRNKSQLKISEKNSGGRRSTQGLWKIFMAFIRRHIARSSLR